MQRRADYRTARSGEDRLGVRLRSGARLQGGKLQQRPSNFEAVLAKAEMWPHQK